MRTHIYVLILTCSVFSMQAMLWSGPARPMVISALYTHMQLRFVSGTSTAQGRKIAAYDCQYHNEYLGMSRAEQEVINAKRALSIWDKHDPRRDHFKTRQVFVDRVRRAEEALSKEK